ncbi:hypothetical protein C7446_1630 [Kushneria sinocarnis]|uniref:Uncharacterized protein n=1 Tax=Kushneria sinocarnis TaxID=595502 RepID=A0A420WXK2_9GAMM|nr:hypothetical protein C7446_1630 [Kushneria sinocarnis]
MMPVASVNHSGCFACSGEGLAPCMDHVGHFGSYWFGIRHA